MSEKTWDGEPFWGLGYEWDPDWVLTDRQRELRDLLIELCEKEMRANAKSSDDELEYPAPQPGAARRARLPRADGARAEYGGLGEDHVAYAMTCETIARYGCASTAMCYVMHMGAVNAIMLRPTDGADRQVHPAAEQRQDRHAVLLGPGDRLALLVPDLLRRRALQRRLQGAQEGVVDDLRRVRRLLRRADDEPRLHRLRRPVGVRDRRRARQGAALDLGRARPARQPVRADRGRRRRDPGRPDRRPGGRRRGVQRRVGRPVVPDRLVARSGTGSRWARSTSPSARRRARSTSTSACGWPTTRRSRTTSARR